jgi:hypothetical protein
MTQIDPLPLDSEDTNREPVPIGGMPNGRCRMHGGKSPRAPKGKANGNYRHGLFTRKAVESRRELNAWIRAAQRWAEEVE